MSDLTDPPMGFQEFTNWFKEHREVGIAWPLDRFRLVDHAPDSLEAGLLDIDWAPAVIHDTAKEIFALWPSMPINALADLLDHLHIVLQFHHGHWDEFDCLGAAVALTIRKHMKRGF